jgi:hypothetical protein
MLVSERGMTMMERKVIRRVGCQWKVVAMTKNDFASAFAFPEMLKSVLHASWWD